MLYTYKTTIKGEFQCGADHPEYGRKVHQGIKGLIDIRNGISPKNIVKDFLLKKYNASKNDIIFLEVEQIPII